MLIKHLIDWDEYNMECVDVVDNGESALRIIERATPDIVITDIRMPKMNGLDLIGRSRELGKKIKFIVISGYKEFEYAQIYGRVKAQTALVRADYVVVLHTVAHVGLDIAFVINP